MQLTGHVEHSTAASWLSLPLSSSTAAYAWIAVHVVHSQSSIVFHVDGAPVASIGTGEVCSLPTAISTEISREGSALFLDEFYLWEQPLSAAALQSILFKAQISWPTALWPAAAGPGSGSVGAADLQLPSAAKTVSDSPVSQVSVTVTGSGPLLFPATVRSANSPTAVQVLLVQLPSRGVLITGAGNAIVHVPYLLGTLEQANQVHFQADAFTQGEEYADFWYSIQVQRPEDSSPAFSQAQRVVVHVHSAFSGPAVLEQASCEQPSLSDQSPGAVLFRVCATSATDDLSGAMFVFPQLPRLGQLYQYREQPSREPLMHRGSRISPSVPVPASSSTGQLLSTLVYYVPADTLSWSGDVVPVSVTADPAVSTAYTLLADQLVPGTRAPMVSAAAGQALCGLEAQASSSALAGNFESFSISAHLQSFDPTAAGDLLNVPGLGAVRIEAFGNLSAEIRVFSSTGSVEVLQLVCSTCTVSDGLWHHVLLSFDATSGALTLWLDSQRVGQLSAAAEHAIVSSAAGELIVSPGSSEACIDNVQFWTVAAPPLSELHGIASGAHPGLLVAMPMDSKQPPNVAASDLLAVIPGEHLQASSLEVLDSDGSYWKPELHVGVLLDSNVTILLPTNMLQSDEDTIYITSVPTAGTLSVPDGSLVTLAPYRVDAGTILTYRPGQRTVSSSYDRFEYVTASLESPPAGVVIATIFSNQPPSFLTVPATTVATSEQLAASVLLTAQDADLLLGDELTFSIEAADDIVVLMTFNHRSQESTSQVLPGRAVVPATMVVAEGSQATIGVSVQLPTLSLRARASVLPHELLDELQLPADSVGYAFNVSVRARDTSSASALLVMPFVWLDDGSPVADRVGVAGYSMILDSDAQLSLSSVPEGLAVGGFSVELWLSLAPTSGTATVLSLGGLMVQIQV